VAGRDANHSPEWVELYLHSASHTPSLLVPAVAIRVCIAVLTQCLWAGRIASVLLYVRTGISCSWQIIRDVLLNSQKMERFETYVK
jgi:hypothetical protein